MSSSELRPQINWPFWIAVQCDCGPAIGVSLPGYGKTSMVEQLAKRVGAEEFNSFETGGLLPEDGGGYTVRIQDEYGEQAVEKVFDIRLKSAYRKFTVLFLDELNQGSPATQAAFQQRLLDVSKNSPSWVCGAMNPPEVATMGRVLPPAVVNRCCIVDWEYDEGTFFDGLENNCQFELPEIPLIPEDWKDGLKYTGPRIARFLKCNPRYLPTDQYIGTSDPEVDNMLKDDGTPFPSPRSWEFAVHAIAAAQSVNANEGTVKKLIEGIVGEIAYEKLNEFESLTEAQDPEELLNGTDLVLKGAHDQQHLQLYRLMLHFENNYRGVSDKFERLLDLLEQAYSQGASEEVVAFYNQTMKLKPYSYVPRIRDTGPIAEIEAMIYRCRSTSK